MVRIPRYSVFWCWQPVQVVYLPTYDYGVISGCAVVLIIGTPR